MPEERKETTVVNEVVEETETEKTTNETVSTRDMLELGALLIGGTVGLGFVVKKLFFRKKKKYATVEPEGEYFRSR